MIPQYDVDTRLVLSLRELLSLRPLQKITVKDICRNANVSVRSFYYHYKDKNELMGVLYYREADKMWYEDGKLVSLRRYFEICWQNNDESEQMRHLRNAMKYDGQNSVHSVIEEHFSDSLIRLLMHNNFPGEIDDDVRNVVMFYSCGVSRITELHFNDKKRIST